MRRLFLSLVYTLFLFNWSVLHAQNVPGELLPVSLDDFNVPDTGYLAGAGAVYLMDIGRSEFVTHSTGKFTLEYKRQVRIKINNANGFGAATFSIPLYFSGMYSDRLASLNAITYNLENGAIVQTTLTEDQVFVDKRNKKLLVKKFTMPGVKAGSVIDVIYHVSSDFLYDLHTWNFQGAYPRMWSEYTVVVPVFFEFFKIIQGDLPFFMNTASTKEFSIDDINNMGYKKEDSRFNLYNWVIREVPSLKNEPFTSAIENHLAGVRFYQIRYRNFGSAGFFTLWGDLSQNLIKSEYFGSSLYSKNKWLDESLQEVVAGSDGVMEKARKIYAFIRDNFTCTDHYEVFLSSTNLRDVLKTRTGTTADLNLLLIAMLFHENIEASPVIISTIENGRRNENYPILSDYNRTIAVCLIDGKVYYLDASEKMLGFGKLKTDSYNGHARIIRGNSLGVFFEPDSLIEKSSSQLSLSRDIAGNWKGSFLITAGDDKSLKIRSLVSEQKKEEALALIWPDRESVNAASFKIANADNKDEGAKLSFDVMLSKDSSDNSCYLQPLMGGYYEHNPFQSTQRSYPVEMPFKPDETYDVQISIPDGYVVDDLPATFQTTLNDKDGLFEYAVSVEDNKVLIHSRLLLNKAYFAVKEYESLRNFYSDVVRKCQEQIVLKKVSLNGKK